MTSQIEEEKQALRKVLELIEALEQAETEEDRLRIVAQLKELAMDRLGVKGSA